MTDTNHGQQGNVFPINGRVPGKPLNASQLSMHNQSRALLAPASLAEAVALISENLALVRPVGMGQHEAEDWLRVAMTMVVYLPPDILADACFAARRTATHPSQIVPAIIKAGDCRLEARLQAAGFYDEKRVPASHRVEHQRWEPSRAELEAIKADAARNLSAANHRDMPA